MDLPSLWHRQQHAPFPYRCMKTSVGDRTLLAVDVAAARILTGCLRTDGAVRPLAAEDRRELEAHAARLDRALGEVRFEGEDRAYFERLREVIRRVLEGAAGSS